MTLLKTTTIPAPDWFIDLWDKSDRALEKAAEIIKLGAHWLKQAKPPAVNEAVKNLSKTELQRYNTLMIHHHTCRQMAWSLLRITNLNTNEEIALAERMNYDEEKKEITAKTGMFAELQNKVQEISKQIFS